MRIFNVQQVARPAYYDRNASNQTKFSLLGPLAPHVATTRWSYTVPAGKKAFIEQVGVVIWRSSVAAPNSQVQGQISFIPNGAASTILMLPQVNTNGVLDVRDVYLTNVGEMSAGDALSSATSDASTGGTMTYILTAKIQEFDV